jgi:hypothetical protein
MPSTSGVVASANRSLEIPWLTTVAADNPFGWWKCNEPEQTVSYTTLTNSGNSGIANNLFWYANMDGPVSFQNTGIVNYSGNKAIYSTDTDGIYQYPCIFLGETLAAAQTYGYYINDANAFTMECLIKFGDSTSRFTYGRQEANALGWGMLITQTSGKFYVTAWVGNLFDIGVDGDTGVTIDYDKWYHIVYTYESTRSRLYINGAIVLEKTFAPYTWPRYWPTRNRFIGLISSYPNPSNPSGGAYDPTINASFDELVMYKSTLSNAQVVEHTFASGVLNQ